MALRRRVVWTKSARAALDSAIEFIHAESPSGANRVLESALATAQSLAELAERGRVVPEFQNPAIREVFVFSYRLIYRVSGETVEIVQLLHGARDSQRWLRELE